MKTSPNKRRFFPLTFICMLELCGRSIAQLAPIPFHVQVYPLHSSAHRSAVPPDSQEVAGLSSQTETVTVAGAPWIQLQFAEWNLGEKSYLLLTSLEDGAQQRLDGSGLTRWNGRSACFNGDRVRVELHVSSAENGVFFDLDKVMVGERENVMETICGDTDGRVPAHDAAVGRIVPVGGTGWIIANGAHLTAGHCVNSDMQILEFNIPASDADGTINHPTPDDQYPIDFNTVKFFNNNNIGRDWAVFHCNANSAGRLPIDTQQAFYRLRRDQLPTTVSVTGYGVDDDPQGTSGGANSDNQTLQTHTGALLKETTDAANDVYFEHVADTRGGNSGSPIIDTANGVAVGIHTHGGCLPTAEGSNKGASFENDDLENAINTFFTNRVAYVDAGHPVEEEDGTICRPFNTVQEGVSQLGSQGGVVSIVKGTYAETLLLDQPMTLTAPVGEVTIGP